tara:strand:- start:568 stop:762 length:195 start_codon:yes stop_codon:yes gene_type:complete
VNWEKIRDGVYTSGDFDLFRMDEKQIVDGKSYEIWNVYFRCEYICNASSLEQAKNICREQEVAK